MGGGSGGGRGSGGGAPTLLLALRVVLLFRRRFRREADALAAEIGTVRVSSPVELLAVAAAFTVGVTILARSARACASRRSKSGTDRACSVSVWFMLAGGERRRSVHRRRVPRRASGTRHTPRERAPMGGKQPTKVVLGMRTDPERTRIVSLIKYTRQTIYFQQLYTLSRVQAA